MRTFIINGNTYNAKPFGFNLICDLEERGISLDSIADHPMSFMRVYLSICAKRDEDFAGEELDAHITNGGTFDDLMNVVKMEMDESGFFQALNKAEKKNTTKSKAKVNQ